MIFFVAATILIFSYNVRIFGKLKTIKRAWWFQKIALGVFSNFILLCPISKMFHLYLPRLISQKMIFKRAIDNGVRLVNYVWPTIVQMWISEVSECMCINYLAFMTCCWSCLVRQSWHGWNRFCRIFCCIISFLDFCTFSIFLLDCISSES